MTITLLYGCGQIETTVRDLPAARAFMCDVLGGGEIEHQMAKEITALFPHGEYAVEHYDCGEALFQLNAPSPRAKFGEHGPVHQSYLERIGPCVTNLNYYVDDAEHARDLLTEMGAATLIEGPSNIIPSLADYGQENTRPADVARKFYFLGARDLIGLDLEIMEPNFQRFTRQAVQYPCFVHPRPAVGAGGLKLLRARLVVPDLERSYGALVTLIAPASRSNPYDIRQGSLAKAFRIGLGGLELEYCQPLAPGRLAEQLDNYGPGVVSIDFAANDIEAVLARASGASRPVSASPDAPSDVTGSGRGVRVELASREIVGFDVVLEARKQDLLA